MLFTSKNFEFSDFTQKIFFSRKWGGVGVGGSSGGGGRGPVPPALQCLRPCCFLFIFIHLFLISRKVLFVRS